MILLIHIRAGLLSKRFLGIIKELRKLTFSCSKLTPPQWPLGENITRTSIVLTRFYLPCYSAPIRSFFFVNLMIPLFYCAGIFSNSHACLENDWFEGDLQLSLIRAPAFRISVKKKKNNKLSKLVGKCGLI